MVEKLTLPPEMRRSTKFEIMSGPDFKTFLGHSHVWGSSTPLLTFLLKTKKLMFPDEGKMEILAIAKDGSLDDKYSFIAVYCGPAAKYKGRWVQPYYYYVGHYNTDTRKGSCVRMVPEKFFRQPIAQIILSERWRRMMLRPKAKTEKQT